MTNKNNGTRTVFIPSAFESLLTHMVAGLLMALILSLPAWGLVSLVTMPFGLDVDYASILFFLYVFYIVAGTTSRRYRGYTVKFTLVGGRKVVPAYR